MWLEDVSASSFKICLRELQNFAGVHDEISVVSVLISMQSSAMQFSAIQCCGGQSQRKSRVLVTRFQPFSRLDIQTTGWCLNIIHGSSIQPIFVSFFFQNWLTFDTLHRPLFKEHNHVSFQNDVLPAKNHNFAFCQVRIHGEDNIDGFKGGAEGAVPMFFLYF